MPEQRGLDWLEALGPQKIRPGLSRTLALLEALGRPDRAFRSLLVGGTNGKGSTAATASALLTAAGVPVGLYTSPHLVSVTERVRVSDVDVSEEELSSALIEVAAVAGQGDEAPTYFEALTVAAFVVFRRAGTRVAVVEVGIGGLLDATNVLDAEVAIVTNVGADHLETLGPALSDVARQKAGIFRPGAAALTAAEGEPLEVLHEEAGRLGTRLFDVGAARVPGAAAEPLDDVIALPGAHQRVNAALAVGAAFGLARLSPEIVRAALPRVRWRGRLETLLRPGRRTLLLDGAHNPHGIEALAAHLDRTGLSGRVDLVFGGLADKDLAAMLAPLVPRAARIVFTRPPSPRAEDPARLAARFPGSSAVDSPEEAVRALDGGPGEPPLLVAGSLYLVGEVLRLFGSQSRGS